MPLTKYIWDVESDNVMTETDENDVTTAVYNHEPDEFGSLISQRRGNVTSTYHYDGTGSTREPGKSHVERCAVVTFEW